MRSVNQLHLDIAHLLIMLLQEAAICVRCGFYSLDRTGNFSQVLLNTSHVLMQVPPWVWFSLGVTHDQAKELLETVRKICDAVVMLIQHCLFPFQIFFY